MLAVHPAAVDMTKEFKPYAPVLFLHLLLLCLAFSYLRTSGPRWLAWTCVVAVVSPLLEDDLTWNTDVPGRHQVREVRSVERDDVFGDFFARLRRHAERQGLDV